MNSVSSQDLDKAINQVVANLSSTSGIHTLYPNQKMMLLEFCQGKDIFYTGETNLFQKYPQTPLIINFIALWSYKFVKNAQQYISRLKYG